MQIRRPIAALFAALALFGGGATMTACEAAGQDQNDGTTDDGGNGGDSEDVPDNSDPEQDSEDENDDSQDPE